MKKIINKIMCYDDFTCIADRCSFTCCQEWKIAVDDDTMEKWTQLGLANNVTVKDGCRVMKLNSEKKCPYLNNDKLCALVVEHGDSILSNTCATFPRQIHEFENRVEYSLVTCCPEVIDLLQKKEYTSVISENEVLTEESDFFVQKRNEYMSLIQDDKYSISKAFQMIFYSLLEAMEGENADMSAVSEAIDNMEFSFEDTWNEVNELFLDLIENYKKQGLYRGYLENITELAEKLENEQDVDLIEDKWNVFQSDFRYFDRLFRKCIAADFYTNLLIPDTEFDDMVVMIQWIAMEYSVIRHAAFLKWLKTLNGTEGKLTYEDVRDLIVVFSRITGYGLDDIYDYLEHSFETVIWEWGYMALVTGK